MKRLSWALSDIRELPVFIKMSSALKRAGADGEDTCGRLIVEKAEAHPNRTFLKFEEEELSYGAFNLGVNRYCDMLSREGVGRGDVVAIVMRNCPAFFMAEMACAKLGAIGALVNNFLTGSSMKHVLGTSGAKVAICEPSTVEQVLGAQPEFPIFCAGADLPTGVQSLDSAIASADEKEPPVLALTGSDLFLYIYTSGTTGFPKPALVRHMKFTMGGIALGGIFDIGETDTIYGAMPMYHGFSKFAGYAVAMRAGGAFATRRKFSASEFLSDVRRHDATMFVYVGELCRYILAQPPGPMDKSHLLRKCAGAGMRPDVWELFTSRFGIDKVFEMYGATEGNVSLINRSGKVGSIGKPNPFLFNNIRVAKYDVEEAELVRDSSGRLIECDFGEPGECLSRVGKGPIQFDGSVDKKASEKKLVRDGFAKGDVWFRTGDMLSRDAGGYFYFVDRLGDTFRWKGENVATQEVEEVLNGAPGVVTANVYGVKVPGADGRAGMTAVVLGEGEDFDAAAFYEKAAADLPSYARPLFVRLSQEIDQTGTLKLKKVDLQKSGFDPAKVSDPLFVCDPKAKTYVPLSPAVFAEIESGERRL